MGKLKGQAEARRRAFACVLKTKKWHQGRGGIMGSVLVEAFRRANSFKTYFKDQSRTKYGNKKTTYNGIVFDSKAEADFYLLLLSKQQAGEVLTVECQPVIVFPNGTKMIPDFKVTYPDVSVVYYDVKSPATRKNPTYRLKKKLLAHFFPEINFQEVCGRSHK